MDFEELIDSIDWTSVSHAYGPAINTPKLLRALATGLPIEQNNALDVLFGTINHQGSIYTASVPCIPILLKILEIHRRNKIAIGVVELLLGLAVGDGNDILLTAPKLDWLLQKLQILRGDVSPKPLVSSHLTIGRACYKSVRDGIPLFLSMLNAETSLMNRVAYLLAFFPLDNKQSVPIIGKQLKNSLESQEKDYIDLANQILNFGLTEFWRNHQLSMGPSIRPLLSHAQPLVRHVSSIYLSWDEFDTSNASDAVSEALEELCNDHKYEDSKDIFFCSGALTVYADFMTKVRRGEEISNPPKFMLD